MLAQDALIHKFVAIANEHGALCLDTVRVIYLVVVPLQRWADCLSLQPNMLVIGCRSLICRKFSIVI